MLKRFAPLVPIALSLALMACSSQEPQVQSDDVQAAVFSSDLISAQNDVAEKEAAIGDFSADKSYKLPELADSILNHGLSLVGTRYRFGGGSVSTGFDCSGFIGYLFKEEAGMMLPRSTREMININAPLVARGDLQPGDLLFFSTAGRGRVSHAGIYLGDDQFIHSSSRKSGGVRVDSLGDGYWKRTFIEAKRALAMAPSVAVAKHP